METLPKQHLGEVHAYVAEILNNNKCRALCVGGTANHIHILFCLNRTMTLRDIVRTIKSSTSQWINKNNNSPFARMFWQDGYGAFSVSPSHLSAVTDYISNQQIHHRGISYEDEFRRICQKYDVPFDERYVWD